MFLTPGTIVDERYEIHSVLGAGGFGIVYRARHLALERLVAIKVLPVTSDIEPDSILRFEAEARTLSTLQHRNLVIFYGFGIWNSSPYMALELLQGENLQSMLQREGKLSVIESLQIMTQICEGLELVHRRGIVHRDLKPSNIMVLKQQSPDAPIHIKIIDFGLAKLLPSSHLQIQRITEAGMTVGSAEYMSPEQCLGEEVDHRSDLYAAGCVLFRCLTGTAAFSGEVPFEIMQQQLSGSPAPLNRHLAPGSYPDGLQHIVNRALVKIPDNRYQSAEEILHDLKALQTQGKMVASPSDDASGLPMNVLNMLDDRKWTDTLAAQKRNKFLMRVGITAAITIVISSVVCFQFFAHNPLHKRPASNEPADDGDGDVARQSRSREAFKTAKQFDIGFESYKRDAIKFYKRAFQLNAKDHLLTAAEATAVSGRIARLSFDMRDYDEAKLWSEKTIALDMKTQKPSAEMFTHFATLADILLEMNKPDELIRQLEPVHKWWIERTKTPDTAVALLLAKAYTHTQQQQKALTLISTYEQSEKNEGWIALRNFRKSILEQQHKSAPQEETRGN